MFCWDIFGIRAASQVFPYSAKNLLRFMPCTKAHQLKVELIETLKMLHYREKLLRTYKGLMDHDFLCLTSGLAVRDKW